MKLDQRTFVEVTPTNENLNEETTSLVKVGSEIFGGAAGAVVGLVFGPIGGIVGAAGAPLITHSINKISEEIKERVMGKREEARTGAVLNILLTDIQKRIKNGEKPRDDDFFSTNKSDRSSAEEILEGVLLASQRDYEEKKLRFYGKLFSNIAFTAKIDKGQANVLIRLAKDLSYRQLCLLRLFVLNKESVASLRDHDYNGHPAEETLVALLQEILELDSKGMVNCSGSAILGLSNVIPSKMIISGTGVPLYNYMALWEIPDEDLKPLINILSK